MSAASRNKGKVGERELAALLTEITGFHVRRRVRQHDGDSDLEGVPGWSIECKRYASATPAVIEGWWHQTVTQARQSKTLPVLFYRVDRGPWLAVWPSGLHPPERRPVPVEFSDTLSADPTVWWRMAQHILR